MEKTNIDAESMPCGLCPYVLHIGHKPLLQTKSGLWDLRDLQYGSLRACEHEKGWGHEREIRKQIGISLRNGAKRNYLAYACRLYGIEYSGWSEDSREFCWFTMWPWLFYERFFQKNWISSVYTALCEVLSFITVSEIAPSLQVWRTLGCSKAIVYFSTTESTDNPFEGRYSKNDSLCFSWYRGICNLGR